MNSSRPSAACARRGSGWLLLVALASGAGCGGRYFPVSALTPNLPATARVDELRLDAGDADKPVERFSMFRLAGAGAGAILQLDDTTYAIDSSLTKVQYRIPLDPAGARGVIRLEKSGALLLLHGQGGARLSRVDPAGGAVLWTAAPDVHGAFISQAVRDRGYGAGSSLITTFWRSGHVASESADGATASLLALASHEDGTRLVARLTRVRLSDGNLLEQRSFDAWRHIEGSRFLLFDRRDHSIAIWDSSLDAFVWKSSFSAADLLLDKSPPPGPAIDARRGDGNSAFAYDIFPLSTASELIVTTRFIDVDRWLGRHKFHAAWLRLDPKTGARLGLAPQDLSTSADYEVPNRGAKDWPRVFAGLRDENSAMQKYGNPLAHFVVLREDATTAIVALPEILNSNGKPWSFRFFTAGMFHDGSSIYILDPEGVLHGISIETQKARVVFRSPDPAAPFFSVLPATADVVVLRSKGEVMVFSLLNGGKVVSTRPLPQGAEILPAGLPTGFERFDETARPSYFGEGGIVRPGTLTDGSGVVVVMDGRDKVLSYVAAARWVEGESTRWLYDVEADAGGLTLTVPASRDLVRVIRIP